MSFGSNNAATDWKLLYVQENYKELLIQFKQLIVFQSQNYAVINLNKA